MVTINSKTLCLSEDTEATNEISVKLKPQRIITKTAISFDQNFDQLNMNNSFGAENSNLNQHFKRLLMR